MPAAPDKAGHICGRQTQLRCSGSRVLAALPGAAASPSRSLLATPTSSTRQTRRGPGPSASSGARTCSAAAASPSPCSAESGSSPIPNARAACRLSASERPCASLRTRRRGRRLPPLWREWRPRGLPSLQSQGRRPHHRRATLRHPRDWGRAALPAAGPAGPSAGRPPSARSGSTLRSSSAPTPTATASSRRRRRGCSAAGQALGARSWRWLGSMRTRTAMAA
mmetsp:Transcript_83660/g.249656  ORF Transcript_83660/g.249656 Transcript_83660/m.249656 type:complete len:223 (+) Transcript_83660:50-718(+)